MWVILRRLVPDALELAAANAHDRRADFRITFFCTPRLGRAIDDVKRCAWILEQNLYQYSCARASIAATRFFAALCTFSNELADQVELD